VQTRYLATIGTVIQVVAIDGGAGSGKSTLAKSLAEKLGWAYFDTGAMYRSLTLACVEKGVDVSDQEAIASVFKNISIQISGDPKGKGGLTQVSLDGHDVSSAIRTSEIGQVVPKVAAHPKVRELLVTQEQQWINDHGNSVVEGRDIASVVWPNAILKIFLTANLDERARRRRLEFEASGDNNGSLAVEEQIANRDESDSTKGGLTQVGDAIEIDTTDDKPEDTLNRVLGMLKPLLANQ
jgi:cytidylate kinase